MPFSHHSHSGEFCGHAANTLAEVIDEAVNKRRMLAFHLTEHCPRSDAHLYPEEVAAGVDAARLGKLYDDFVHEAVRLRQEIKEGEKATDAGKQCHMLIGFEAEWIDAVASPTVVEELLSKHSSTIDYFIGSVHHVKGIPIDFDRRLYEKARGACGATDIDLYHEYFDAQFEMLKSLKPALVGHVDLIRLFSDAPDQDLKLAGEGSVWAKIIRNLDYAKSIGAVLEINTAAWRKGLQQPYPRMEICRAWKERGGEFVLSDDSHGVSHIGTNYQKLLPFLDDLELQRVAYLTADQPGRPRLEHMSLEEVKRQSFWETVQK